MPHKIMNDMVTLEESILWFKFKLQVYWWWLHICGLVRV